MSSSRGDELDHRDRQPALRLRLRADLALGEVEQRHRPPSAAAPPDSARRSPSPSRHSPPSTQSAPARADLGFVGDLGCVSHRGTFERSSSTSLAKAAIGQRSSSARSRQLPRARASASRAMSASAVADGHYAIVSNNALTGRTPRTRCRSRRGSRWCRRACGPSIMKSIAWRWLNAGRADLAAVGLVGAVGDQIDAELALGAFGRDIDFAGGDVDSPRCRA